MKSDVERFADFVEYREAMTALEEFGPGFNVIVERKWPIFSDPVHVVTITKREGPRGGQTVGRSDGNLLAAVRAAVEKIREVIAEDAKIGGLFAPGAVATGQQGPQTGTAPGTLVGPDVGLDLDLEVGEPDPAGDVGRAVAES